MADVTLHQALQLATQHLQAGQLTAAASVCRQILIYDHNQPEALHLLGLSALQVKDYPTAIDCISQAVALKPAWAEAVYHLGVACQESGRLADAASSYRRVLSLKLANAQACDAMGDFFRLQGDSAGAIEAHRQAVRVDPLRAASHNNLGVALQTSGQVEAAIPEYRRAVELQDVYPQAFANLAFALRETGHATQACHAASQAIAQDPASMQAHVQLGLSLEAAGQHALAIAVYEQAISTDPSSPQAQSGLGISLHNHGRFDEAIDAFNIAIRLRPGHAGTHNNLGNVLMDLGQAGDAILAYQRAVELDPTNAAIHSALIFAMHYRPDADDAQIAEESARWSSRQIGLRTDQGSIASTARRRVRTGRIRIGWVSPDFREHPVGRFLLPLLRHMDSQVFELFCYSDVAAPDAVTSEFVRLCDQWLAIDRLSHADVANRIHEDQIEILVDLTGHSTRNRLPVFARKPAPIQISYLGFPGDTGLTAIDYRLTDVIADPRDLNGPLVAQPLRLFRTSWCFAEPSESPPVQLPPFCKNGFITFGSFNSLAKVTDTMFGVWAEILAKVQGSRLLLKATAFVSKSARERTLEKLARRGIESQRVEIIGPVPTHWAHLATYARVDLALDTFPYNGTTTTCDALWMGVPVLTLTGNSHRSRVGASLLRSAQLDQWIAHDTDDYVARAVKLAGDQQELLRLRDSMRHRMSQSSLMDSEGYCRAVESILQAICR